MISKFTNLFKKNDLEEQREFQNRVVKLLIKQYQNYKFEKSNDPLVISYDKNKLGLSNLYAKFLLSSQTNYELLELAAEHFESVLDSKDLIEGEDKSWDEVKSLIFPQLMSVDFTNQFSAISFPFDQEVVIGFVVDSEKAYRYIVKDDLKNWEVDDSQVSQAAIENLAARSIDLEMTFVPPPNGILVINTMDGFDAVRIIIPHLQEFIAEKLGKTFYFGIPNRDFLICWAKKGDANFQTTMKQQIAADFKERPYPFNKYAFCLK